jgi:trimeric autotransporter adhesin
MWRCWGDLRRLARPSVDIFERQCCMYMRKLAAAAGIACGAALVVSPLASADTSSDWLAAIDGLLGGGLPGATDNADFQVSFDGYDLFPTTNNLATATTVEGQFGLAIAYGDGSNATAEGGIGNFAMASGTNALAKAGDSAAGATGSDYNTAVDIGSNVNGVGAPDGAYAGASSLIGNAASIGGDSHNSAFDFGNNGLSTDALNGGNSGAFAGDGGLVGAAGTAGSGNTAYTFGNINGFGDGSAAVAGDNNLASTSGAETGTNEGAFAAFGNSNTAIADTTYTTSGDGVSATYGNDNYAYVYAPNDSTASAGGAGSDALGNNDVAYVDDPYGNVNAPDTAVAGDGAWSHDLAEVLFAHGNASATGADYLYDIVSLLGNETGSSANSFFTELASLFGSL